MIIGSTALKYHFSDQREPKDLDTLLPPSRAIPSAENFWDDRIGYYQRTGKAWETEFATPDELYTLKVSHSFWEIGNTWNKHIRDVQFLKSQGAKLIPEFYDILYPIWVDKHGSKRMQFKMDGDFFKDAVVRKYDHDSLHDSVAYGDEAMYIKTLKQPGHTAVNMEYVKGMPFEDQVKLFREEVCATALERKVVPSKYKTSAGAAYTWALRRTITSLTKGWSALFIVDNYSHFSQPCNYVERHLARKDRLILL